MRTNSPASPFRVSRFHSFVVALLLVALVGCGGSSTQKPSEVPSGESPAGDRPRILMPMGEKPAMEKPMGEKPGSEHLDFPTPPSTENYHRVAENPFLVARTNPLSTLGVTIDTASYSNVRRFLQQERRLPPPDAVRVAELVNYFSYSYPEPRGNHPVAFHIDQSPCPWNAAHHLVRIALKGKTLSAERMPPRNFVFLIDSSGSMASHNKLPLLRRSLGLFVEKLGARDRVAIVAYASSSGLVLPSTPGNRRESILRALDRLEAGGSTNGGEGIELAYRVAQEHFIEGGLNRVILGTDGDFNVGISSEGELIRLIERKRKSGVYLTVLGLGMGNLKDSTMESLARYGNGHYAYLDSDREARKVFVEQGGALVTIAKDVKFQVEFNPAKVGAYRLIGYENRLLRAEDFNDDSKDTTDIGSGHTITVFFEVVPASVPLELPGVDTLKYQQPRAPSPNDSDEWLTVKLRYKDPESEVSKLIAVPLKGNPTPLDRMSEDFRFASAVAEFGLLLSESKYKGQAQFSEVSKSARDAVGDDPNGYRREFLRLVETAARLAR